MGASNDNEAGSNAHVRRSTLPSPGLSRADTGAAAFPIVMNDIAESRDRTVERSSGEYISAYRDSTRSGSQASQASQASRASFGGPAPVTDSLNGRPATMWRRPAGALGDVGHVEGGPVFFGLDSSSGSMRGVSISGESWSPAANYRPSAEVRQSLGSTAEGSTIVDEPDSVRMQILRLPGAMARASIVSLTAGRGVPDPRHSSDSDRDTLTPLMLPRRSRTLLIEGGLRRTSLV